MVSHMPKNLLLCKFGGHLYALKTYQKITVALEKEKSEATKWEKIFATYKTKD